MAGDYPRLIRCHLAGSLIEERATKSETVRVVPFLVDVGRITHAAEVAVLVGLVELVGNSAKRSQVIGPLATSSSAGSMPASWSMPLL